MSLLGKKVPLRAKIWFGSRIQNQPCRMHSIINLRMGILLGDFEPLILLATQGEQVDGYQLERAHCLSPVSIQDIECFLFDLAVGNF